ncbi:MAG: SCP2 sterol-binding domain-containing protein [Clostridia bacterium]|nr:SCP2 sterol-binding domain-containing protein [Clostridia bacterium]
MTFEQAFLKIKAKFDNADTSKLTSDFAIQVNMTDEDCAGAFYIQSTDGKLLVEPYDYRDNSADVTLKRQDLVKILDGKLTVAKALETGKLYVNGNAEDLVSAASVIKAAPAKKAPAKKAPAKKAEPKKVEAKAEVKKAPVKKAPAKKAEPKKTEVKVEVKPEVKAPAKAEVKAEVKTEVKAPAKTEVKTEVKKATK